MEEELEDSKLRQEIRREIRRAKGFGWKIVTIILSILFICSIVLCVLFATGMLVVRQSSDGSLRLEYVSPFREVKEDEEKQNHNSSKTDEKQDQKSYSSAIESFDLKLDEVRNDVDTSFEGYNVTLDQIRVTSDQEYIIAVVRVKKNDKNGSDLKYYIRSTGEDSSWRLLNKTTLCFDYTDQEFKELTDTFPDVEFVKCLDDNAQ